MTISQPKSIDEEISLRVQAAIEKIEKVEEDAEKEKSQIVRDLAKDLEGKIPTNRIANEIVHQLHGKKISPRTIRKCLDEKYKEKHRVANARKQKKKDESTDDLAAPVPLNDRQEKEVAIDTFGNEVVIDRSNKETDYEDENNVKEGLAQNNRGDVPKCENCQLKDATIEQLEEVLRKTKQMTPADQIGEYKVYKIKQVQQELDEHTRELELQTEVHKDENRNTANIAVTNTVDFEFWLLLGDMKYHLLALYQRIGDAGKVWFSGKFDKDSGKIHSIRFGRIGEDVHVQR